MAFELEGFTVVRGPDVLWGGDIRRFHPPAECFGGVIGGPPCQSFSSLAHLVRANGHQPKFGNLIPEFERCVREASPAWFVMENVPQAPEPCIAGYGVTSFLLDNSHLLGDGGFGQEQKRVRRFSFGLSGRKAPNLMNFIDLAVFFLPDPARCVVAADKDRPMDGRKTRRKTVLTEPIDGGHSGPRSRRNAVLSDVSHGCMGKTKARKTRHEAITGGHDKPPSVRSRAVTSNVGGVRSPAVTAMQGGETKRTDSDRVYARRYKLADAIYLQGLPSEFLADCPLTAGGKLKAVANGVPVPMGRAIAKAVKEALQ